MVLFVMSYCWFINSNNTQRHRKLGDLVGRSHRFVLDQPAGMYHNFVFDFPKGVGDPPFYRGEMTILRESKVIQKETISSSTAERTNWLYEGIGIGGYLINDPDGIYLDDLKPFTRYEVLLSLDEPLPPNSSLWLSWRGVSFTE
jgi:hypothetical protein